MRLTNENALKMNHLALNGLVNKLLRCVSFRDCVKIPFNVNIFVNRAAFEAYKALRLLLVSKLCT